MTVVLEPTSGTQFVDGALQVFGIDGASAVEGSGREGVMGDPVDLAWEAARGLEQRLGGGRLEERQFAASQTQAVSEVGVEFVALQDGDVMADDKALIERFVNGHGQPAAQFGEADQEQAQAVFGVHRNFEMDSRLVVSLVLAGQPHLKLLLRHPEPRTSRHLAPFGAFRRSCS